MWGTKTESRYKCQYDAVAREGTCKGKVTCWVTKNATTKISFSGFSSKFAFFLYRVSTQSFAESGNWHNLCRMFCGFCRQTS